MTAFADFDAWLVRYSLASLWNLESKVRWLLAPYNSQRTHALPSRYTWFADAVELVGLVGQASAFFTFVVISSF